MFELESNNTQSHVLAEVFLLENTGDFLTRAQVGPSKLTYGRSELRTVDRASVSNSHAIGKQLCIVEYGTYISVLIFFVRRKKERRGALSDPRQNCQILSLPFASRVSNHLEFWTTGRRAWFDFLRIHLTFETACK